MMHAWGRLQTSPFALIEFLPHMHNNALLLSYSKVVRPCIQPLYYVKDPRDGEILGTCSHSQQCLSISHLGKSMPQRQ